MRVNIIIPIASIATANQVAANLTGSANDLASFGAVRLSATGNEPWTYTGCSTYMSNNLIDSLPAMAAAIKGCLFEVVPQDNDSAAWQALLTSNNLQAIRPEIVL